MKPSNHNHHITMQELERTWEQSLERATLEQSASLALTAPVLNNAAGLHVQAGVRGGGWFSTQGCNSNGCSAADSCDNC